MKGAQLISLEKHSGGGLTKVGRYMYTARSILTWNCLTSSVAVPPKGSTTAQPSRARHAWSLTLALPIEKADDAPAVST